MTKPWPAREAHQQSPPPELTAQPDTAGGRAGWQGRLAGQAPTPHSEDRSNSHKAEIPPWWDHKEHLNIPKQLELPQQLQ